MDDHRLFDELLRATKTLELAVRVEPFETSGTGGGGSCILGGERLILLDARAPLRERIGALARALSELETETIFMVPEARQAVELMKRTAGDARSPEGPMTTSTTT